VLKPGAAPAAVWMAHRAIPLDTSGYGQILGECSFSTKLYYCYWLTLADDKELTAIPYYAWSHRGVGEMTVWLRFGR